MKNKREIIESKYPPRNNEDIWLKDLLLYASTTKGWLPLGSEKTYSNKTELLKDTPTGGTIGIDKETGIAYLYNDVSKEWTPVGGGGGGMTETTWQELKDKRDNGELNPGSLYRITDYNCTTTQENTQSAGHQFDIVLLALSANKLAEEGWAMEHPTDVYDVTFSDGVTKKCYLYDEENSEQWNLVDVETLLGANFDLDGAVAFGLINIDRQNKTIVFSPEAEVTVDGIDEENLPYNYFQNSNLSAWKVWYCLDNDKSRFAWADDSKSAASIVMDGTTYNEMGGTFIKNVGTFYEWRDGEDNSVLTENETPAIGDDIFTYSGSTRTDVGNVSAYIGGEIVGHGVIYRLIDEFNNDCPYDFKNIQTKLDGEDAYEYTFYIGPTGEMIGVDSHTDISIPIIFEEMTLLSANNKIGYFINETIGEGYNIGQFLIPFIHLESTTYYNTIGSHASQVKLSQCSVNTIGDFAEYISLDNVRYSSFGQNCGHNGEIIISNKENLNYGNNGVELATKDDIGDIETALNNI